MLVTENTTLLLRLKRPGEANGAGGNAIEIFRAQYPGRGYGDIGGGIRFSRSIYRPASRRRLDK